MAAKADLRPPIAVWLELVVEVWLLAVAWLALALAEALVQAKAERPASAREMAHVAVWV